MGNDIKNEDALVLVSGGQDSTTCLFWALKHFNKVSAITFEYGQKHSLETSIIAGICKDKNVPLKIVDISFIKDIVISNLFKGNGDVDAKHPLNKNVPASFVPYRNALFLTIAAGWGSSINVRNLVIGVCETDYSGYADCRDIFIKSIQQTLNLATDFKNKDNVIYTPLMWLTKAEEFKLAEELGCLDVIIQKTLTCYNGATTMNDFGMGCGKCNACRLRKKGYHNYLRAQNSELLNPQSAFAKASADKSAILLRQGFQRRLTGYDGQVEGQVRNPQSNNPLGERSEYPAVYNNALLFPVLRGLAREKQGIDASIFSGVDIWNCYEVSWLDKNGKPEARILRLVFPGNSEFIVESKSLKLYLNSFNSEKFDSEDAVLRLIEKDLGNILQTKVELYFYKDATDAFKYVNIDKNLLIDDLSAEANVYQTDKSLLSVLPRAMSVEHEVYSNLLKTNCPVTGQPDWGTVYIKYKSEKELDKESLLKYIVSYRNTQDFHEVCCERIFTDIHELIKPEKLLVKCYYTRRGGIDINPVRFVGYTVNDCDIHAHLWRQ